jgi:hypothetical protein
VCDLLENKNNKLYTQKQIICDALIIRVIIFKNDKINLLYHSNQNK